MRQEVETVHNFSLSIRVMDWTGTECREFEREFATWSGTLHAMGLSNRSLALDVALKTPGNDPGDKVVATPRTFIDSVACVVNVRPMFY